MEDKEITAIIRSNLLGALVYKSSVRRPTVFTCNYCCFCWLCNVMKLKKYVTEDVGSCCDRVYVFRLVDNSSDTDDLKLHKEVQEIITSDFTLGEEMRLIEMSKKLWLYEKGLF